MSSIYEICYRLAHSINNYDSDTDDNGKWWLCFYITEAGKYKLKVSADNDTINASFMEKFICNIESQTQIINKRLREREYHDGTQIALLEVQDIEKKEAKKISSFNSLYSYSDANEDIETWDSGIHKLIVFELLFRTKME